MCYRHESSSVSKMAGGHAMYIHQVDNTEVITARVDCLNAINKGKAGSHEQVGKVTLCHCRAFNWFDLQISPRCTVPLTSITLRNVPLLSFPQNGYSEGFVVSLR